MKFQKTLKVLVFDTHPITRKGIRMMLENMTIIANVSEATTDAQFYQHLSTTGFDLILLSVNEPDTFSVGKLSAQLGRTVLLYTEEGAENAIDLMTMGGGACMSKKCIDVELREGITAVLANRRHACTYTRAMADRMITQSIHF
ncbi:hypothetical protein GCM10010967_43630 [Dyadobacter beijingensis]|uniref:Response regulatory domain-containing protein n=1 Tax=Dyadobacter beijingensis TaxID=365489 RepID=A0ABQ2IAC2_9BACT|nr:response regulator transcription factor [Dyadobacter beijingensis]GGN04036.1 hypothetical protein GCM10010967_43630 [Dyadobacter beijingensis]